MQIYLGVQHQGCGERKIYLAKEREEGDADTCKNPLLTPQFTFCCEKELNLHVNPFKLKYPLSNSGKKKNLLCLPFSILPDSTEAHHRSTGEFCKCLLLYGSPAVSNTFFLGNVEDAMHQINLSFSLSFAFSPKLHGEDFQVIL